MCGIEQWLVFGGSWGSTLALAYGEAHPERCLGFVLRGCSCAPGEIDWFLDGAQWFHPEVHAEFIAPIPAAERGNLLQAYAAHHGPGRAHAAVRAWSRFEGRRVFLLPQAEDPPSDALDLGVGRLESLHGQPRLLQRRPADPQRQPHRPPAGRDRAGPLRRDLPAGIGMALASSLAGSVLHMIPDAGHGAMEKASRALVAATEQFKRSRSFAA
jgi:proline iminopeptidase